MNVDRARMPIDATLYKNTNETKPNATKANKYYPWDVEEWVRAVWHDFPQIIFA